MSDQEYGLEGSIVGWECVFFNLCRSKSFMKKKENLNIEFGTHFNDTLIIIRE